MPLTDSFYEEPEQQQGQQPPPTQSTTQQQPPPLQTTTEQQPLPLPEPGTSSQLGSVPDQPLSAITGYVPPTEPEPEPVTMNAPALDLYNEWYDPNLAYVPGMSSSQMANSSSLYPKWLMEPVEPGYGIPEWWDYRTAKEDWNGNPLPLGALGFDPSGQPYYGEGYKGWARKFVSGWFEQKPTEEELSRKYDDLDFLKEELPEDLGTVDTLVANWNKVSTALSYSWDYVASKHDSLFRLTQAAEAVGGLAMTTFNFATDLIERPLGAVMGTIEDLGVGPSYEEALEAAGLWQTSQQLGSQGGVLAEMAYGVSAMLEQLGPSQMIYNGIRLGINLLTLDGEQVQETFKENWEASRIAYSWFGDAALKQEYIERFKNGEMLDPETLAMELEKPWAEMAVQSVLDPMNVFDFFGKAATDATRLAAVSDSLLPPSSIDELLDGVRRLPGGADNAGAVLDDLTTWVTDNSKRVREGMRKQGDSYKLLDLTAEGKRYKVQSNMSDLVAYLGTNSQEDDLFEGLRAMMMMASDDPAEIAEGIAIAGTMSTPRVFFGDAAFETGHVLRTMLTDDDGVFHAAEFLDEMDNLRTTLETAYNAGKADDIAKAGVDFVQWVTKKTDDAMEAIFPKVLDNPNASAISKVFGKVDDLASKAGRDKLNQVFSTIYMGTSPGYAFRNRISNTMHVMFDVGAGAFTKDIATHTMDTLEWLKSLPSDMFMGFGLKGGEDVSKVINQKAWKNAFEALKGEKGDSFLQAFSRLSEYYEQNASVRVVGKTVEDTMRRLIQPGKALPDPAELIEAGFTELQVHKIRNLTIKYKGDVRRAGQEVLEEMLSGSVDQFRSFGWMDSRTEGLIAETIGMDEFYKIADAPTKQKALDMLEDSFQKHVDTARGVYLEHNGDIPSEPIRRLAEAGLISDDEVQVLTDFRAANRAALAEMQRSANIITTQAYQEAARLARVGDEAGSKALMQQIDRLQKRYMHSLFTGSESQKAVDASEKLVNQAWYDWTHPIRETRFGGDPENWWGKIPGLGGGTPPDDLTKDNFWGYVWDALEIEGDMPPGFGRRNVLDYVWDIKTKPSQKAVWQTARDSQYILFDNYMNELSALTGADYRQLPHVKQTLGAVANARAMDDVVIVGEQMRSFAWQLKNSENVPGAIRTLSGKYGISSITTKGKYFDNYIINVIKKYGDNLPEDFSKLSDLTFTDAVRAFENYRETKGYAEVIPGIRQFLLEQSDLGIDEAAKMLFGEAWEEGIDNWDKLPEAMKLQFIGDDTLETINDVPPDVLDAARRNFNAMNPNVRERRFIENLPGADSIASTYDGGPISLARSTWERLTGIRDFYNDIGKAIDENWGKFVPTPNASTYESNLIEGMERYLGGYVDDLGKYHRGAEEGIKESRLITAKVANAMRDFTLHTYPEKTNLDIVLSYIMPYQFWYNRTYTKWFTERIVRNPSVIASYMRYKDTLSQVHANAPDWWKNNINTNELLGLDAEHPLFMNLEATLNPLNGLVGVDFNDPMKRVNWWTNAVDQMQKFGPSLWTPISIAIATALYKKGEEDAVHTWNGREYTGEDYQEAAARWAGRLFPQTATLKAFTSMLGNEVQGPSPLSWILDNSTMGYGTGVELDPLVTIFAGGIDPYERRRIGRALGTLAMEDPSISEAELLDAARTQEGDLWDQAKARAAALRAPGQISSFMFGVGFKGRTPEDMVIDKFYEDWNNMWRISPNYSPDEVRQMNELMRQKYPFMDTVLLSRKGGTDRDRSYSYNVLGRLPPGSSYDIATAAGMDAELLDRFYDDKGNIASWTEADRTNFLNAVVQMGAMIEVPDNPTRQEYSEAKTRYSDMRDDIIAGYGDYIWERIDFYNNLKSVDRAGARDWLDEHPEVEGALDTKTETVLTDPLLMAYYGSLDTISSYYQGEMWNDIENQLGEDVWQKWDEYWALDGMQSPADIMWDSDPFYQQYADLKKYHDGQVSLIEQQLEQEFPGIDNLFDEYYDQKDVSSSAARAYWKAHPELSEYKDREEELFEQIGGEWYDFREQFWPEEYIEEMWDLYNAEKEKGGDPQSEFWDANPELSQYMDLKQQWLEYTNEQIAYLHDKLPQGKEPELRTEYPRSQGEIGIAESLEPQAPQLTYEQWEIVLGAPVVGVISTGTIPEEAYPMLQEYANQMGITLDQLIIAIRNSEQ